MSIVRATPRFMELRGAINDAVLADFGAAGEYVKVRRPGGYMDGWMTPPPAHCATEER